MENLRILLSYISMLMSFSLLVITLNNIKNLLIWIRQNIILNAET